MTPDARQLAWAALRLPFALAGAALALVLVVFLTCGCGGVSGPQSDDLDAGPEPRPDASAYRGVLDWGCPWEALTAPDGSPSDSGAPDASTDLDGAPDPLPDAGEDPGNACGGDAVLAHEPGDECLGPPGPCAWGVWVCLGADAVDCAPCDPCESCSG